MKIGYNSFRAWLEDHKPKQVVGVPDDCEECPIGRYLASRGEEWPLRTTGLGWVYDFMAGVDDSGYQHITAHRALKILDEVQDGVYG